MTSEEGELHVATLDDLQCVLDMSGVVYYGMDYVPSCYSGLVTGPGVKAFLYKVKDEVVAFAGSKVIDEGQTLTLIAARVKAAFQGQGVYGRFHQKILAQFTDRAKYPNLRREVMATNTRNFSTNEERLKTSGWREVYRKNDFLSIFKAASLSNIPLEETRSEVTPLSADRLRYLFQEDPACWLHLFPHRRITVNWKPYAIMADNVTHILSNMNAKFYGTRLAKDGQENFSLLSAGSYYPCAIGIYYSVDFFGDTSGKRRLEVEAHLMTHLRRLQDVAKTNPGDVVFLVFSFDRLDDVVGHVTRPLKPKRRDWFKIYEKVHVLEREMTELQPVDD